MPRQEPKKPDPIVLLAKASARKRRRPILPGVILSAILLALLGSFVWWAWPTPELPAVALAVFDEVALADESVRITARLEPLESSATDAGLEGSELFFQAAPDQPPVKGVADSQGYACAELAMPQGLDFVELVVRYPGIPYRRRGVQAWGHVFVWPADASLLLIDADHLLCDVETGEFWQTNNLDVKPRADAAKALTMACQQCRPVYLSLAADKPTRANKLRAWLHNRLSHQEASFPRGPLLASAAEPRGGDERLLERCVASLRRRFTGRLVAIVGSAEWARRFHDAGLETYVLGKSASLPAGVKVIASWQELSKALDP